MFYDSENLKRELIINTTLPKLYIEHTQIL